MTIRETLAQLANMKQHREVLKLELASVEGIIKDLEASLKCQEAEEQKPSSTGRQSF